MHRLLLGAGVLWWGSLTTVGFFVVPMLFLHLPSPAIAGAMAAKLFAVQAALSTLCGMVLLLVFRSNKSVTPEDIAQTATIFIVGGILLALLVELAVAPRIVARDNLVFWHRVGSAMLVGQWLCATVTLWKLTAIPPRQS